MNPSQACVDLVKSFEGFSATAYTCAGGKVTIGYGSTDGVTLADTVTEEEAEAMLLRDLEKASDAIDDYVDVPLTQGQFDALVAFSFNVGAGAFRKSTLLKKLNAGDAVGAAAEFLRWNKAKGRIMRGLVKRRKAEMNMFLGMEITL